jgi:hypothetical protein
MQCGPLKVPGDFATRFGASHQQRQQVDPVGWVRDLYRAYRFALKACRYRLQRLRRENHHSK